MSARGVGSGGGGGGAAGAGVGYPDQVAVAGHQDLAATAAHSVAEGGGREPLASDVDLHALRSAIRTQRVCLHGCPSLPPLA